MRWDAAVFSLPFYYLFVSRLRSIQDRLSWILVQPVAHMIVIALYVHDFSWMHFALAVLAMATWQAGYEIGYLHNDTVTTDREVDPTLRVAPERAAVIRENLTAISATRLVLMGGLFASATGVEEVFQISLNAGVFIAICLVGYTAFALHNVVRSRWNIATYAVLSWARYSAVPLLLVPSDAVWEVGALCFLMMAMPRSIEHAAKPKYEVRALQWTLNRFHELRVVYYGVLSVGAGALAISTEVGGSFFVVFIYYLLLRTGVLLGRKVGLVTPTVHRAYQKCQND